MKRYSKEFRDEAELRAKNRELERENNELRQPNDILKDALGFFTKRPEEVKTSERICLSRGSGMSIR